MNKFIYLLAGLLLASCSSKGLSDAETSEGSEESQNLDITSIEEEIVVSEAPVFGADGIYNPPFEITYIAEGEDNFGQKIKQTNVMQLLANGRVKGNYTTKKYLFNMNSNNWNWVEQENMNGEMTGTWSSYSRKMGNGYQTVYEINTSANKYSYYLPDDAEYIWGGQNAYSNCENYNIKDGAKIVEIKPIP